MLMRTLSSPPHLCAIGAETDNQAEPDQYTMVSAPLKILKVLIAELSGNSSREIDAAAAAELGDEDEDDGDWEDEPNAFQNLTGGLTKQQIMQFAEEDGPSSRPQTADNETQGFLIEFFKAAAGAPGFHEEWDALTAEEQTRLRESAE